MLLSYILLTRIFIYYSVILTIEFNNSVSLRGLIEVEINGPGRVRQSELPKHKPYRVNNKHFVGNEIADCLKKI